MPSLAKIITGKLTIGRNVHFLACIAYKSWPVYDDRQTLPLDLDVCKDTTDVCKEITDDNAF